MVRRCRSTMRSNAPGRLARHASTSASSSSSVSTVSGIPVAGQEGGNVHARDGATANLDRPAWVKVTATGRHLIYILTFAFLLRIVFPYITVGLPRGPDRYGLNAWRC